MDLHFEEITKDPMRGSVQRVLEEAIIKNELKPGDRLVESKLSEMFGISRGPIREAIASIEKLGLAEKIPFRGAVVSNLSENDIAELKSCRKVIEILAVDLILEKPELTQAAIVNTREIAKKMSQAAKENDLMGMLMLDFQFHDSLVASADNSLLSEMWEPVSIRLRRYFFLNSKQTFIPLNEAYRLHQELVEALTDRDHEHLVRKLKNHECWS